VGVLTAAIVYGGLMTAGRRSMTASATVRASARGDAGAYLYAPEERSEQ